MGGEICRRSGPLLQRLCHGLWQADRYGHILAGSTETHEIAELGVDRDDTGFAKLVNKAAREGKPLDKVFMPGGGSCPFSGTGSKGREAKL